MHGKMDTADWLAFGYCAALVAFCVWCNVRDRKRDRARRMFTGNRKGIDE